MRKIVRLFAITAGALLMVSCAQTSGEEVSVAASAPSHDHHVANSLPADAPMEGMSIYQVESEWTDQHGATRRLAELAGRPRAVAMVYTNCGSACPRIVMDLKRLEGEFPELGLVLVSIDPERDTPGRLAEFAQGSHMGDRWTLLNGSDDDVLELAAVLGVRYRRIGPEDFMHSTVISILDEAGNILHRQEALGETHETIEALRERLAHGRGHHRSHGEHEDGERSHH